MNEPVPYKPKRGRGQRRNRRTKSAPPKLDSRLVFLELRGVIKPPASAPYIPLKLNTEAPWYRR